MFKFILFLLITAVSSLQAKEFTAQARLFLGLTSVDPVALNSSVTAEGLKKIEDVNNFAVEITVPTKLRLELGMRYTKRIFGEDENPSNNSTEFKVDGSQDSILLLARLPLIKSSLIRADVFAGIGGSNTSMKIKTSVQDGELSKKVGGDSFASTYSAYGASVGIGFKKVFLFAEGGIEKNEIDNFTKAGNVNSSINKLDLSGSYLMIGIMFDGVQASKQ